MKALLRKVSVMLLVGLVAGPAQAGADDLRDAIQQAGTRAAAQGRPLSARDWDRAYDRALARKGGGKKKIVWGAILLGPGIGVRSWATGQCIPDLDDFENLEETLSGCGFAANLIDVSAIALWSGVGVAGWGTAQYIMANGELKQLDASRPDDTARIELPTIQQAAATAPVSYTLRW